jgi:ferredoxin-like protein FixX
MEEDIKNAIEACDKMENCVECSTCYRGFQGDKSLIPCNYIRLNYGVSIWDYKRRNKHV